MTATGLGWYARRLARMSPSEVGWRVHDRAVHRRWRSHWKDPRRPATASGRSATFDAGLPAAATAIVPPDAAAEVIGAADLVLAGRLPILGVTRPDLGDPDWFLDPVTGRRAPDRSYCFSIDHRSEEVTGNVKQLWELSRLQHLTVLAAAHALSGRDLYAVAVARQLRSWWAANPVLSGVNWSSGIELGIRLISWAWTRRLLDGWAGAADLFERHEQARLQIWWHQRYLSTLTSRGSSANNHVVAEASGLLVGALAFPWFEESSRWEERSRALLEDQLDRNTFADGVNREMAFAYHGFTAELALAAAVEADRAGRPLSDRTWQVVAGMLDVVAATLDASHRPPRYGDDDGGRAYLLGSPRSNRWTSLLAAGRDLAGGPDWWPDCPPDAASHLIASIGAGHPRADRPARPPVVFPAAGVTILRTSVADGHPEIWCRCDGGPHGYLSLAAHAHADALSVEVRHDGVDVLADPGTYCYHGEPQWRRYFRSTLAHNTVEVGGRDQSVSGGPFMWTRHAGISLHLPPDRPDGPTATWAAEHDGYTRMRPPVRHRRRVSLERASRRIRILDELSGAGSGPVRLAFHLGPHIEARLDDGCVHLEWVGRAGARIGARLDLPDGPRWTEHRGSLDPVLGWYSPSFGTRVPSTTVIGTYSTDGPVRLETVLRFLD